MAGEARQVGQGHERLLLNQTMVGVCGWRWGVRVNGRADELAVIVVNVDVGGRLGVEVEVDADVCTVWCMKSLFVIKAVGHVTHLVD